MCPSLSRVPQCSGRAASQGADHQFLAVGCSLGCGPCVAPGQDTTEFAVTRGFPLSSRQVVSVQSRVVGVQIPLGLVCVQGMCVTVGDV